MKKYSINPQLMAILAGYATSGAKCKKTIVDIGIKCPFPENLSRDDEIAQSIAVDAYALNKECFCAAVKTAAVYEPAIRKFKTVVVSKYLLFWERVMSAYDRIATGKESAEEVIERCIGYTQGENIKKVEEA